MFDPGRVFKCVICGKIGHWDLLDNIAKPERMCPACIKAVKDATEQLKYLKNIIK